MSQATGVGVSSLNHDNITLEDPPWSDWWFNIDFNFMKWMMFSSTCQVHAPSLVHHWVAQTVLEDPAAARNSWSNLSAWAPTSLQSACARKTATADLYLYDRCVSDHEYFEFSSVCQSHQDILKDMLNKKWHQRCSHTKLLEIDEQHVIKETRKVF